jgi:hypothetical protein
VQTKIFKRVRFSLTMKKSSCFLQFCDGKAERVKQHERERKRSSVRERWSTRERKSKGKRSRVGEEMKHEREE